MDQCDATAAVVLRHAPAGKLRRDTGPTAGARAPPLAFNTFQYQSGGRSARAAIRHDTGPRCRADAAADDTRAATNRVAGAAPGLPRTLRSSPRSIGAPGGVRPGCA